MLNNPRTSPILKFFARGVILLLLLAFVLAPVQSIVQLTTIAVVHAQPAPTPTPTPTPSTPRAPDVAFCNDISTCLTSVVYLFAVFLPTQFAYVSGYLFNYAIQLALNSASYALNFLSQGWALVRDLANLTFIFIIIYIAYTIIVQAETAGTMRTLAWVIAMALLINFSFFITRVVIDAGNILAVQFYNAIDVRDPKDPSQAAVIRSPIGGNANQTHVKDLTAGIMNAVKIQTILSDASFKQFTNPDTTRGNTATANSDGLGRFLQNVFTQTLVYISVGIFLSLLGFIFLIVAIKLMVRMVILWFVIIASPLAFAAHALPNNKNVVKYYHLWLENLLQSAFYPAVFLFLFFILNLFMSALAGDIGIVPQIFRDANDAVGTASNEITVTGVITIIASVGVRMGLVIVLLYFAMKFSDSFSSVGNSFASWTTSKVANLTAGAAGWAARNTVGRGANSLARSESVRDWAAKNPLWGGRLASGALNRVATSSLDVRGAPGVRPLAGKATVDLKAPSNKGGYRKKESDKAEAEAKFAKTLKSDAVYVKENAVRVGRERYNELHGPNAVANLETIKNEGAQRTQQRFETEYDAAHGGAGAYQREIQNQNTISAAAQADIAAWEQRKRVAEAQVETFRRAGNTAKVEEESHKVTEANQQIAAAQTTLATSQATRTRLETTGQQRYENANTVLGTMEESGKSRIKALDNQRLERVAKYLESRRMSNLYVPSVGDIDAAMKVRGITKEKSRAEKIDELLSEGTTPPPAPAPAPAPSPTPAPQPLTQTALKKDTERYGGLKGATEKEIERGIQQVKILDTIHEGREQNEKSLDELKNLVVQRNARDASVQSAQQRPQQPSIPTPSVRPPTPQNKGETRQPINVTVNVAPTPVEIKDGRGAPDLNELRKALGTIRPKNVGGKTTTRLTSQLKTVAPENTPPKKPDTDDEKNKI